MRQIEGQFGAGGFHQATCGQAAVGVLFRQVTRSLQGDIGTQDHFAVQQSAAAIGAVIERKHVGGLSQAEAAEVKRAHSAAPDDADGKPAAAEALGLRHKPGHAPQERECVPVEPEPPAHFDSQLVTHAAYENIAATRVPLPEG